MARTARPAGRVAATPTTVARVRAAATSITVARRWIARILADWAGRTVGIGGFPRSRSSYGERTSRTALTDDQVERLPNSVPVVLNYEFFRSTVQTVARQVLSAQAP